VHGAWDRPGCTCFQVLVGPGTAFEKPGLTLTDFPDGSDNTIRLVEAKEPVLPELRAVTRCPIRSFSTDGIDGDRQSTENGHMSTSEHCAISPDVLADLEAVCNQVGTGGVKDPELLHRVHERGEQARAEILRRFGVQEIGVQIIREMREGR
jgi:hypothetical protein